MISLVSYKPETDELVRNLRKVTLSYIGVAQIVCLPVGKVSRVSLRLKKRGAPTGNILVKLMSTADLSILATSDNVDVSTVSDVDVVTIDFDFSTAYYPSAGYYYACIHGDYTTSDTDYIEVYGLLSGSYGDGEAYYQTADTNWHIMVLADLWFDVQGEVPSTFTGAETGLFGIQQTITGAESGLFGIHVTITGTETGLFGVQRTYTDESSGHFRIANDALARYELYVGVDADPDPSAAPAETFSTLPHTTAATFGPGHFYRCLVRKRNQYDLASQNIYGPNNANIGGFTFTVNGDGSVAATKPSAPEDIAITASSGGTMLVTANYQYLPDGANAATRFLVWLTSNGVDPNPADAPTVVAFKRSDGLGKLRYTTPAYAAGLTIKTLVRVRRVDAGPVNVDSDNVTIYSDVSETAGPSAASANLFIDSKEQVQ